MRHLNNILSSVMIALALAGCAASEYKNARLAANEVRNGMTIAEAAQVLGLPPSHQGADFVEWRRGNAQKYDGTPRGAIRFELRDGKIVNVPEGGIFSEAARKKLNDKWLAARQAEDQSREAAEIAAEAARLAAEERSEQEKKRRAVEEKREIAEEAAARASAYYTCADKVMCGKAFALAQIYVAQNADQKIQVVTDTIIQTYNPTEPGKVGMSIVKTPGKGAQEVVEITATCESGEYNGFASLCRQKRTRIYGGFHRFIEARLKR